VYRLITGEYQRPYKEYPNLVLDFQIIVQVAKNCLRPTLPTDCPSCLATVITKCWNPKPEERPTCSEILGALLEMKSLYEKDSVSWQKALRPRTESSSSFGSIMPGGRRPSAVEDLYIEMKKNRTRTDSPKPQQSDKNEPQQDEEDSDSPDE